MTILPPRKRSWHSCFDAVVVGCATGSIEALQTLLKLLPTGFRQPIIIIMHGGSSVPGTLRDSLADRCRLPVREAEDKEPVVAGVVYFGPTDYHLLIEAERSFALSIDARVCRARPSIDVLFESAAEVWRGGLFGVLLTGANHDGTRGLKAIHAAGGMAVVQDPVEAPATMPRQAVVADATCRVLTLGEIAALLIDVGSA